MEAAMGENNRRRLLQETYNTRHGITPESVKKNISNILASVYEKDHLTVELQAPPTLTGKKLAQHIRSREKAMLKAASDLNFEEAASIRDEIRRLRETDLEIKRNP